MTASTWAGQEHSRVTERNRLSGERMTSLTPNSGSVGDWADSTRQKQQQPVM
uniref:Uncharacterized protein n=1 Tax=Anguilla anguilla TaxID=7936 RepID=A0A0E9P8F1_ANGAN